MEKSVTMKMKTVKASTAKPNVKPPLGNKLLGIDPYIHFNEL